MVTTARAATAASAAQAAQAAADALHARGGGRRARRELARAALEASHRAEGKGADSDSGGGGGGKSDGGSGSRRGYAFQLHARDGGGCDSEDWLSDSDDEVRAKVARERAAARVARGGPRAGGDVSDGASGSDVGVLSTHPRARGATIAPPRGAVLTARERRGAARAAAAASAALAVGYHDVSHAATEPRTSGGPTFAAAAAAAAATAAELVAARARAAAAAPRRSVSADAPEAGDWTSANLPREWARPAHGGPPAWVHPDDAAGAAARARREAAEAALAAAFDWLGPQTHGDAVAAAARGSGVIDFAAGAGRDVVLARARDDVVVVAFADPASVAAVRFERGLVSSIVCDCRRHPLCSHALVELLACTALGGWWAGSPCVLCPIRCVHAGRCGGRRCCRPRPRPGRVCGRGACAARPVRGPAVRQHEA